MAEERTTWLALLTQFADNDTGAITAEALRDLVQSVRPWVQTYAPDANSDETHGFDRGHKWLDITGPTVYECADATATAAVWLQTYPQAGGGGGAWGSITGTLADQTDLQAALDDKADASSLGTAAAADVEDFATAAQGGLADSAMQPGDPLTDLTSGAATVGHVPKADGAGGITWAAASGGGGGIAPEEGLVVVQHGSNASESRPTAATVYWLGSVAPTNRQLGDLWLETGAFD